MCGAFGFQILADLNGWCCKPSRSIRTCGCNLADLFGVDEIRADLVGSPVIPADLVGSTEIPADLFRFPVNPADLSSVLQNPMRSSFQLSNVGQGVFPKKNYHFTWCDPHQSWQLQFEPVLGVAWFSPPGDKFYDKLI